MSDLVLKFRRDRANQEWDGPRDPDDGERMIACNEIEKWFDIPEGANVIWMRFETRYWDTETREDHTYGYVTKLMYCEPNADLPSHVAVYRTDEVPELILLPQYLDVALRGHFPNGMCYWSIELKD